jgi:hypothetical protein
MATRTPDYDTEAQEFALKGGGGTVKSMEMLLHHFRIVILPLQTVVVVIPASILHLARPNASVLWQSIQATQFVLRTCGVAFVGVGLVPIAATILLFALGNGTPAL